MSSKSKAKRELIISKAEQVFIRKGFNSVTMKDIINECEISRGGVYVYFSSVDEIFKEVVAEHNKQKRENVILDIEKGIEFNELIDSYFDGQKKRLLNMENSLKTALMEFFLAHKGEYSQNFILSQFNNSVSMMMDILKHSIDSQKNEDIDLLSIAENVMFFIEGISTLSLLAGLTEEIIDKQFQYIKQIIFTQVKYEMNE